MIMQYDIYINVSTHVSSSGRRVLVKLYHCRKKFFHLCRIFSYLKGS